MTNPVYAKDLRPATAFKGGSNLPIISTQLDSVRAYQFEIHFTDIPEAGDLPKNTDLTLAAKQVGAIGIGVEDIAVRRVNDLVYYPGAPTFDSVSITFDNLLQKNTSKLLMEWFKTIYNPMTGDAVVNRNTQGGFKAKSMRIVELDNTRAPVASVDLYGVYPKNIRFSEKNYSTSEFSTVEVEFRFDYIDYVKPA